MKTKRLIYAGLATMLFSSSLINVPAQVSAAESSRQQSEIMGESQKSVSSSQTSSSATSADQSSVKQATTESSVMSKSSSMVKDTPAVGLPDGAPPVTKNGWSFLLTILRKGFDAQPQDEQYVVAGDTNNPAEFTGMHLLGSVPSLGYTLDVARWHWDGTKAKWVKDNIKDTVGTSGLLGIIGFYDVKTYTPKNLAVGDYAFQFHYQTGGLLGSTDYYSRIGRVSVLEKPVPAETIDTTSDLPSVLYPDVDYDANALVTPTNTTDKITWTPTDANTDKLTFTPNNGRKAVLKAGDGHANGSDYVDDKYYTGQVNKDPNVDGIPAKFDISAGSLKPTTKNVVVGGLPAFNGAADGGGTWQVGGLADLVKASGATGSWHYKWNFTDANGDTIPTPTAAEGVTNTEGDITTLTNLNTEKPLTFAKDSSFMKKAAVETAKGDGQSYRAQLTLTTKINADSEATRADTTIKVVSNLGELQAMPATGKLSLDSVPSFHFNTVDAEDLYEGTAVTGTNITATADKLKVTDTRVKPGWKLSAKLTRMQSRTNDQLTGDTITMSGLPKNVVLDSTNKETDIISSDDITATDKSYDASITGKLGLTPNPQLKLTDNEAFSSNVTWTLTSTSPDASSLK